MGNQSIRLIFDRLLFLWLLRLLILLLFKLLYIIALLLAIIAAFIAPIIAPITYYALLWHKGTYYALLFAPVIPIISDYGRVSALGKWECADSNS